MCTLSERIEQVKLIKIGNGVQYLLSEAYKILENPIVMFDTNYSLISKTEGIVTDDYIWNDIVTNGSFSDEAQELFKKEGFIDDVANAKTIAFLFSDKIKYDRILGKVFNKNKAHVANLVIVACNRPFCPDDTVVFEAVCKIFSSEISTNAYYQDYEKTYQEALIKKLIDGDFIDKELYAAHIAILYDGLKDNLYTAVLDFAKCGAGHANLVHYRDLFNKKFPMFKYSIYFNYIVIILSFENTTLNIKKALKKFDRLFKQKNIYAGVSGCFENIYELPKYYRDALKALSAGLNERGAQRIFLHDDMAL